VQSAIALIMSLSGFFRLVGPTHHDADDIAQQDEDRDV
jgi:hypothetical protein